MNKAVSDNPALFSSLRTDNTQIESPKSAFSFGSYFALWAAILTRQHGIPIRTN